MRLVWSKHVFVIFFLLLLRCGSGGATTLKQAPIHSTVFDHICLFSRMEPTVKFSGRNEAQFSPKLGEWNSIVKRKAALPQPLPQDPGDERGFKSSQPEGFEVLGCGCLLIHPVDETERAPPPPPSAAQLTTGRRSSSLLPPPFVLKTPPFLNVASNRSFEVWF
jgi:hypothetical protein